jgi:LAS superfamily LD-carboxypeptidase LdcB
MFPVVQVSKPADLANQSNGQLAPSVLVLTTFAGRGQGSQHALAARAWSALAAAARIECGATLTVTSTSDVYRTYEAQEALFRRRYQDSYNPLTCTLKSKMWNGVKWWQLRGVAMAAVPGTSNHGWGLAVDAALWTGSGVASITSNAKSWAWLQANAVRFGWSWEVQSEPWHIRYYAGDKVPAAVLAFENGTPIAPDAVRPVLRIGSTGPDVRDLQMLLTKHGYPLAVDGQFGSRTDTAVRKFQLAERLFVDGIVGPRTWKALEV